MQMAVYKRPSGTAAKTKSAPKDTKEEDTSQPSEVPTAEAPAETPTEGEKANTEKEKPTEKDTKEEKDTGGDLASQLSKTESLEQKLQLVRSQDMPLNEKLELLNRSLDLKEWNKLNGRFNTAKKRSAEVAEVAQQNTGQKKHRVMVGSLALDPAMQDVWQEMKHTVSGTQAITKTDEWVSWTKMLKDWSEEEITLHLQSGRFSQRECVDTPGVWELKDNNKVKTEKTVARGKQMTRTSNDQLQPENKEKDEEDWSMAWNAFGQTNSFNDTHLFGGLAKGSGKSLENASSSSTGDKGKTKGKGKVQVDPTALVDKKKAASLKAMVQKNITQLGCLGFEAEDEQKKQEILQAKKEMETFKGKVAEAEKLTNQSYQELFKQVTALQVENNKKYKK